MTLMDIWPIPADPVGYDKTAEEVPVKFLKRFLCSNARPTTRTLRLEACRTCESPCAYGKRMVAIEDQKRREAANEA